MPGGDRPKFLVILKKDICWDFDSGPGSPAGGYGMHSTYVGSVSWDFDSGPGSPAGALAVGDVGTVSIVKIVSLSPRIEKIKIQEVNKRSYLNYGESSVFRVSLHLNILHIYILVTMRH